MSPGIIANPFAAGIGRKNSLESISSIDRDLSPEELEVLQKVGVLALAGRTVWNGILVKSQVLPLVCGTCSITSSRLHVCGISSSQHMDQHEAETWSGFFPRSPSSTQGEEHGVKWL